MTQRTFNQVNYSFPVKLKLGVNNEITASCICVLIVDGLNKPQTNKTKIYFVDKNNNVLKGLELDQDTLRACNTKACKNYSELVSN